MKIATKTGDKGITGTLFGKRLNKNNPIFSCLGDLDELSAFIGLSKLALKKLKNQEHYLEVLEKIQLDLINLMGEVNATSSEERNQYIFKFKPITDADLQYLDDEVVSFEKMPELEQKGWILYGKSEVGAPLDVSSKICRRAERSFQEINTHFSHRELLGKYLNRLSDLLYLMARYFDFILTK